MPSSFTSQMKEVILRELMICPSYSQVSEPDLTPAHLPPTGDHSPSQAGTPHQLWLLRKSGMGWGFGTTDYLLRNKKMDLSGKDAKFCFLFSSASASRSMT